MNDTTSATGTAVGSSVDNTFRNRFDTAAAARGTRVTLVGLDLYDLPNHLQVPVQLDIPVQVQVQVQPEVPVEVGGTGTTTPLPLHKPPAQRSPPSASPPDSDDKTTHGQTGGSAAPSRVGECVMDALWCATVTTMLMLQHVGTVTVIIMSSVLISYYASSNRS
jgi:hypothetical protein